jgi:hypothetical protein
MADMIKCPVCGENNTADQEFCAYCQSRLQPLTGPLKGTDAPLKPGQAPTKKTTAELERALPQWLRDARESGRQASDSTPSGQQQTPAQRSPAQTPPPASDDFLAGLRSQAGNDDEEDLPEWLTSITGDSSKSKKDSAESSDVRWVELGGKNQAGQNQTAQSQPAPAQDETPDWLKSIQSTSNVPSPEKDDMADWFRQASGVPETPAQPTDSGWAADQFSNQQTIPPVPEDDTFDSPPKFSDTPDWLRQLAEDDNAKSSQPAQPASPAPSSFGDAPDWLSQLGGQEPAQPAQPASPAPSSFDSTPDWLRQLDAAEPAQPTSPAAAVPPSGDTPDWLRQLGTEEPAQPASPAPSSFDSTPDWLRQLDADEPAQPASPAAAVPPSGDTPDWLRQLGTEEPAQPASPAPSSFDSTPDWLRQLDAAEPAQPASSAPSFSETPDWLSQLGTDQPAQETPASSVDTPDWLRSMDMGTPSQGEDQTLVTGSAPVQPEAASPMTADNDQDWLRGLGADASSTDVPLTITDDWLTGMQGQNQEDVPPWLKGEADKTPAWLSDEKTTPPATTPEPSQAEPTLGDVPDWLKAAAPQSSVYSEPAAEQSAAPASDESADWLNTFKSETPAAPTPTAFSADVPLPTSGTDNLFTEMPDWLSNAEPASSPLSSLPAAGSNESIAPADLPSWVQAMRPVDSGAPQSLSSDSTLEQRGALAGLQGVLPAVPGYAPTSKPKAYSIKLQASEEQLSQAALLEQILAAEASPVPIGSFSPLAASRVLRITLAVLLLAVTFTVLFLRTQIFAMPDGRYLPLALNSALEVVRNIPEGSPVLVAVNYEPSHAAEMEVAATPLLDQMILLKHPRLTFISTNEKGALLSERIITGPLAGHNYQAGIQYLNLGYLPGGSMGIHAFSENPASIVPFDTNLVPAWDTAALQGVNSLSQFSTMIIITDNIDSARAWIEQTTGLRGSASVIVVSSAQTAPFIQPYYASGQVSGIVGGLHDGALLEQNNANRPGTARTYWDAYSIGMYIAAVFILIGGLWNFALGLRDRAAKREEN